MHTFVALKLRSLESYHLKNGFLQRGLSRANTVVKKNPQWHLLAKGFIVRLRQNCFLLCIIYYTNSHLAKNASGNNCFLFYFYLKYYVEDVVCESQAHWNISRIFRVAVMATTPFTGPKSTKKGFFFTIFFGAFFITPETCHTFLIKPYHSKKNSKTSHTHCDP